MFDIWAELKYQMLLNIEDFSENLWNNSLIRIDDKPVYFQKWQRSSVVRAGNLNAEDPGSNPLLGLLNGFVLGDRGKLTTLCK